MYYCFSSLWLILVSQRCLSITLITKHSFQSNEIKKHSTLTPNLIPDKSVMHQMLLPSGWNDTWLSLYYHCTDMFTPPNLLTWVRRKDCLKEACFQTQLRMEKVAGWLLSSSPFSALVHISFISVVLCREEVGGYVEPVDVKLWELTLILWDSQEILPCTEKKAKSYQISWLKTQWDLQLFHCDVLKEAGKKASIISK